MKCPHCNTLNKEGAKFCKNCGKAINNESLAYKDKFADSKVKTPASVSSTESSKSNNNILIICVTVIICAVIIAGALVYMNSNDSSDSNTVDNSNGDSGSVSNSQSSSNTVSQSAPKSWKLIDSFSGSGTGSESYSIPAGKIKVKISAYPIKNYATNHLYVSSTTGNSAGVDWGSKSAVETRYDSMTFTSSGGDAIDIDYYETVSWNVDVYQYS